MRKRTYIQADYGETTAGVERADTLLTCLDRFELLELPALGTSVEHDLFHSGANARTVHCRVVDDDDGDAIRQRRAFFGVVIEDLSVQTTERCDKYCFVGRAGVVVGARVERRGLGCRHRAVCTRGMLDRHVVTDDDARDRELEDAEAVGAVVVLPARRFELDVAAACFAKQSATRQTQTSTAVVARRDFAVEDLGGDLGRQPGAGVADGKDKATLARALEACYNLTVMRVFARIRQTILHDVVQDVHVSANIDDVGEAFGHFHAELDAEPTVVSGGTGNRALAVDALLQERHDLRRSRSSLYQEDSTHVERFEVADVVPAEDFICASDDVARVSKHTHSNRAESAAGLRPP